jgi:hypothetical protein
MFQRATFSLPEAILLHLFGSTQGEEKKRQTGRFSIFLQMSGRKWQM